MAHRFSSLKACGILVPRPGIEPALEGRFITTGLPGKSLRPLSLTYHWLSSPCPHALPSVRVWVLLPSSHDNSHTEVQSTHMTSQHLNCLFKGPMPNYNHILTYWSLGLQHINFVCTCSVARLCLTLYDAMDCSLPGSSVHGISQARILESSPPFPPPEDLPDPRIEPMSPAAPALAGGFFTTMPPRKQDTLQPITVTESCFEARGGKGVGYKGTWRNFLQ